MKKLKKVLALILAVATMFSTVPIPNYAASNDTSVTSLDGSLIVDDVSNTIKSGTFSLTGNVTVSTLKSKLQTPAAARVKVTSGPTATEAEFEAAQDRANLICLYEGLRVAVMAEDKTLRTYNLIIKSINDDLNSKEEHYSIDMGLDYATPDSPGVIFADNTPITTAVTVDTFLNNLSKHATADWLVAPSTSFFADETALRSELATKTALSKSLSDKLAAGDKLWTVSGIGVVRAYTIILPPAPATTITNLDLTSLVTAPVRGANQNITAIDTAQYTGTIAWYESDKVTPAPVKFAASKSYTAKVSLTAKPGFTVSGLDPFCFSYTGASQIANLPNSGEVEIDFVATEANPIPVNLLNLTTIVPAPVRGAASNVTTVDTAQYSGTISWWDDTGALPAPANFEASKEYVARIGLFVKPGYTFANTVADSFTHSEATMIYNAPGFANIVISFKPTEAEPVSNLSLTSYVPAPVVGNPIVATTINNAQYTGTIDWFESDGVTAAVGTYANNTVYKARTTLTPKAGYTLTGVAANSFTNTNATTVTNAINSGTVWMTFAKTPAAGDTTPPTFAPSYPQFVNITHSTADLKYNINEAGNVEFMLRPSSEPAPTDAEFGTGKITVAVLIGQHNTVRSKVFNSLTPSTAYTLYYRAADFMSNRTSINTLTFTTIAAPDTTPPTFANGYPSISNITHNSVTVSANINEAGSFKFLIKRIDDMFPTNAEFDLQVSSISVTALQAGSPRSALHTGLAPSTDYKLYYKAVDTAGNASNMLSTVFSTTPALDTEPPEFGSNSPSISGITQRSAALDVILFDSGVVEYMVIPSGIPAPDTASFVAGKSTLTVSIPEAGLPKMANLTGLSPNTTYNVFYRAKDQSGNATSIKSIQFKTLAVPDTTAPVFSGGYPRITSSAYNSASLDVKVNEESKFEYLVVLDSEDTTTQDYFETYKTSVDIPADSVNKVVSVSLPALTVSTHYKIFYTVADKNHNKTSLAYITFTSSPIPDIVAPTFAQGLPSVTGIEQTAATFNVNLNEAGTVSYIVRSASQNALTQSEVYELGTAITVAAPNTLVTKSLASLTPGTQYKIYYVASDASNNKSPVASLAFTTAAPPVAPPSGGGSSSGGSGGGGGGGSGASTPTSPTSPTSPISPAPTTTQSRPIDVIVNGVNKSAGTLITGQTSGGQQTATVSVSTSGVVEQLKTPATTGKPSVIVEVPKVSGTGLQATYSAEVTAQSATAMVGAGAGLSVRTPVSTVELSSGALDTLSELMNRAGTGQSASLLVSASPASTTYRPATLGAAPIRSVLTTPIEYTTAVVTNSTRVAVSDYNAFVGRTLSVSSEMLTTAQGQGTPGGTQGVVYINGSAYPVPTFRADGKVTINSITNSVYDLIMYSKSFTDTKGHKYDKSITNMASRLIVTGESAERFNPDAKVTRGEFATMVTRALGLYRGEMGKTKFKDLTKINGINVGITVAADRGLVTGIGKNTFAPSNNITAKEMSQILFNIVKKYGDTSTFTNKASELKTTGYAKVAVAFTTKAGLLEVKSADKEMTRAEAAFAIEQMLEGMNLIDKR